MTTIQSARKRIFGASAAKADLERGGEVINAATYESELWALRVIYVRTAVGLIPVYRGQSA